MKYFLMLIIAGLCWAGYFEYFALQKQNAKDLEEVRDGLSRKIDKLETDNEKLTADLTALKKQSPPPPPAVAGEAPNAVQREVQPRKDTDPPPEPVAWSNELGNIMSRDGRKWPNARALKVDAQGITISSAAGITKLQFVNLPIETQQRFGFDPQQGPFLPQAQADAIEAKIETAPPPMK